MNSRFTLPFLLSSMEETTKILLVKIFIIYSTGIMTVAVLEVINLIREKVKEVTTGQMMSLIICLLMSWLTILILLISKIVSYVKVKKNI